MRDYLPLSCNNKKLYIVTDKLKENSEELEEFISDNTYMNSKEFSNKVLFSQEIKSNNNVEGYNDDIDLVYNILNNGLDIKDKERIGRIRNLYNGYKYISQGKEINEKNLKELYDILSDGLLTDAYKNNMDMYRKGPVYIYSSKNIINYDEGTKFEEIKKYMDEYFSYVLDNNSFSTKTEYFIKSQIMHFQFVNIHPYFDINGRTARTISMWYLLNNKVYPYIIFNRAIGLNDSMYCKEIREVKKFNNLTHFLNFMLSNVRIELEKEFVIDMIKLNSPKLTPVDYQTMYYILSMNGILTVNDFVSFYNRRNDKKRALQIYRDMIIPLLDKSIIVKLRDTNGHISSNNNNFIFELNKSMYEKDPSKIKRLKI